MCYMDNRQRIEHDLYAFGDTTHALGPQHIIQRMAYYGVPGLSLAVIDGGTLAWTHTYGTRICDTARETLTILGVGAALAAADAQSGILDCPRALMRQHVMTPLTRGMGAGRYSRVRGEVQGHAR
jgi:hypothetical protein